METRQVIGLSVGPVVAAGLAMAAWSFLPAAASYAEYLRYGAVGCIAMSVGIWICLLLTAGPPKTADQRKYISLHEAGVWFYPRASQEIREMISEYVPQLFPTTGDSAAAYIKSALAEGAADLYARRGEGFPMEKISAGALGNSASEAVFGSDKPMLFDLSIRRRDLRKVLKFYKN